MKSATRTMQSLQFPNLPQQEFNPNWHYQMRRTMQEIVPNVYLGPYAAVTKDKLTVLQQLGVTHIVCIRHPVEANLIKPNFSNFIRYLVLDMVDSPVEPIMKHFPQVKQFIDECLQGNGKVVLHGNAGISRSPALLIAYLMETYGLNYAKAFWYIQEKRACIYPNHGFVRQLQEFEPIYLANYQLTHQSSSKGVLKRSYDATKE